jgi:hypothetical protein
MAKKETFKEFEKREIAEALAYISNYAKKHPNLLKSAEFPNSAKKFNRKRFAETVDVLMEPFAKAIGKIMQNVLFEWDERKI